MAYFALLSLALSNYILILFEPILTLEHYMLGKIFLLLFVLIMLALCHSKLTKSCVEIFELPTNTDLASVYVI